MNKYARLRDIASRAHGETEVSPPLTREEQLQLRDLLDEFDALVTAISKAARILQDSLAPTTESGGAK